MPDILTTFNFKINIPRLNALHAEVSTYKAPASLSQGDRTLLSDPAHEYMGYGQSQVEALRDYTVYTCEKAMRWDR